MIRPATTDDRGILREMFDEFYRSDAVLHPVPAAYHEAALDDLFSEGTSQSCFLLCRGEKACGYALLSKKYSHEAGGLELWVEELYLRPEVRGKGMGSAFFDYLRDYAAAHDVRRLRLEVEEENTGAMRLYARMGFAALDYRQMIREDVQ